MQHQAAHAYAQTAKITVSPRKLEADLLMKSATRLQAVKDGWPGTQSDLRGALTYNRRLWTIFATSATADENPLPDTIKQNIANLGLFIFKQTMTLESEPAPEMLTSLISINREVAAGLRAE
ncbi:MAG: flagellar biosynthesis regulator FlaF [Rhodobiaceae bacterium]|nr:flagellar biosynthesis regulator FlaF [Rhodobiaceae bacterium]MCC0060902.1 flagellar biosynthesis regulator FlaF [Rhodobiaceae bacterium]